MAVVNSTDEAIGTQIRKKLGRSSEYGQRLYGKFEYGEQNNKFGIYQMRTKYGKQVIVKEIFYWPSNPQSVPQQANRQKLTDAVIAWQALTDNQKEIYNERARYKLYSGYNLYLKEYILSH